MFNESVADTSVSVESAVLTANNLETNMSDIDLPKEDDVVRKENKKVKKSDAVRNALKNLGDTASSEAIQIYIRDNFGLDMATGQISQYRSLEKKKGKTEEKPEVEVVKKERKKRKSKDSTEPEVKYSIEYRVSVPSTEDQSEVAVDPPFDDVAGSPESKYLAEIVSGANINEKMIAVVSFMSFIESMEKIFTKEEIMAILLKRYVK